MTSNPDILCIGSVLWDIIGRTEVNVSEHSDVAGRIARLPGGVAMNIAMTLARFGMRPAVLTAVGQDPEGLELLNACQTLGVDTSFAFQSKGLPTDRYLAIEDSTGLVAAIADAHTLEAAGDAILAPLANGRLGSATSPWQGLIALDGNLTADLLAEIAVSPLFSAANLRVAPASPGKAERLIPVMRHPSATLYVNRQEAGSLCATQFSTSAEAAQGLIAAGAARALVTDGSRDTSDAMQGQPVLTRPALVVTPRRITGAGDTFMAAHIFAESQGADRAVSLARAQSAAAAYVSFNEVTP